MTAIHPDGGVSLHLTRKDGSTNAPYPAPHRRRVPRRSRDAGGAPRRPVGRVEGQGPRGSSADQGEEPQGHAPPGQRLRDRRRHGDRRRPEGPERQPPRQEGPRGRHDLHAPRWTRTTKIRLVGKARKLEGSTTKLPRIGTWDNLDAGDVITVRYRVKRGTALADLGPRLEGHGPRAVPQEVPGPGPQAGDPADDGDPGPVALGPGAARRAPAPPRVIRPRRPAAGARPGIRDGGG